MGYDPELFSAENQIPQVQKKKKNTTAAVLLFNLAPQYLLCVICQELPEDPKQCRSGHIFCHACIEQWLQHNQTCPLDRSPLKPEDLSDCLVAKTYIAQLQVGCPNRVRAEEPCEHNPKEDSGRRDPTDDAQKKRRVRDGDSVAVSRPTCLWTGKFSELETHRKECMLQQVGCEYSCGSTMSREEMQRHVAICAWKIVQCDLCQVSIQLREAQVHALETCAMRPAACDKCPWQGPHYALADHLSEMCPAAEIKCGVCDVTLRRDQMQQHVQSTLMEHVSRSFFIISELKSSVSLLTERAIQLEAEKDAIATQASSLKKAMRTMTKTTMNELERDGDWRVFTFRAPDSERTHYGKFIPLSDTNCIECDRSAVQVGFVVERLRPHEAQQDKLGRWIGIEFEKGHQPAVKGRMWIKFQVFRCADESRAVTFTHNYNSNGEALQFDTTKGALVNDKWGFVWGRSVLLTDMQYANSVGPQGSLFIKYYIRFDAE